MNKIVTKKTLYFLGIFFILIIYFLSGINKIMNFNNTSNSINKLTIFNKLPQFISKLALILVISIWIFGSLILLYAKYNNKKMIGKILSLIFIIFTLIITLYYHYPSNKEQKIQFMKNLSIIGGFIMILGSFYD